MRTSTPLTGKSLTIIFAWILLCLHTSAQNKMKQIDSLLNTIYKPGEPGVAVSILQNGKPIFRKCYGVSDLDKKTPISFETNFNIASLSKQFTALCILKLVEEKKINLDDKLSKYFSGFDASPVNKITIMEMLTHSSGLVDHYDFVNTNGLKHGKDKNVLEAVQGKDSVYFSPGTSYRYSNTAFCILGMIIEKVSGISYEEFVKKNIFVPLQMKNSLVYNENAEIKNRAFGYEFDPVKKSFSKADADEGIFFSTQADGGIYTSIDEYLKWLEALQKATILPASAIKQARSKQFDIDKSRGLAYGFGWFVGNGSDPTVVYHTGSNGGFRSISFTIPSEDYSLVIFSNRTGVDLEELAIEINKILRVESKSFLKLETLISFQDCWPIFAPCKKTLSYLTSFVKNWNVSAMAWN